MGTHGTQNDRPVPLPGGPVPPGLRARRAALAGLAGLAERAVARAEAAGRPVLVSTAWEAPGLDPLAVAEALPGGGFRFVWERPKDRFALAAGGALLRARGAGPERFRAVGGQVAEALALLERDGAAEALGAPFLCGGFAFFDALDAAGWAGFEPGEMVVPAWSALRDAGRGHLVVNGRARPGAAPAALAAELEARLAALLEAAAAPAAPRPPAGGTLRHLDGVEGHRHWVEMVRSALGHIRGGSLSKVVLARASELERPRAFFPYRVLRRLREAYPNCFNFMADPGGGAVFVGATPERLARFEPGRVRLGALAGTAPRGERPDADAALARGLLESPKERAEHGIVVDAIVEAVAPLGGRVERPPAPRLVKLNNVQHLYTPITLHLERPGSPFDLLHRLHPTPAVGGRPRAAACRLIRETEDFDRGWYAGPVGWTNARGEGEFAVALRSGVLQGNRARLFAGGGIVAESDPELEYFETQLKLQPLLSALAHD